MTPISSCAPLLIDALGVVSLVLLLEAVHLLVETATARIGKGYVAGAAALCIWLAVESCSMEKASKWLTDGLPVSHLPTRILMGLPYASVILMLLAAVLAELLLASRLRALRRTSVNSDSVKEALDSLPDGVLFSAPSGRQILENSQAIALGMTPDCVEGLADGPDGHVWQMRRTTLSVGSSQVEELVATDVTEEYAFVRELERRNSRLARVNERLRAYGADLVRITREEEVLAAKIRVHDELGRALVALRTFELQDGDARDRDALLGVWRNALRLLRTSSTPEEGQADQWAHLEDAAEAIDVRLLLEGDLPDDPRQRRIAVALVHECLNNAVRHGGAHEVRVRVGRGDGQTVISVENDGTPPDGATVETGGLANMRKVVEGSGGTMSVAWTPSVVVTATLGDGASSLGMA